MAEVPPLIAEATKKSDLVWVSVPGQPRPFGVWHVWRDDAAYVVTGGGEQPAPGLAGATGCDVTVRSADKGARIVTWRASISRLTPGTELWQDVVPAMLTARLNLTDAAGAEQRWARSCAVLRLTPTGDLVESGDTLPAGSLAGPPPPSPARTTTRVPFTLGRRPRGRTG
ncbi:MAG: hypothetical protein V7637_5824 [Mycobacteriales bacterium]